MKILKPDSFVLERIKVQPVTNADLERAQKEIEDMKPIPIPVSSIQSVDELEPGWFVQTADRFLRIVLPLKYAKPIFNLKDIHKSRYFFVKVKHEIPGYVVSIPYETTFPRYMCNKTFDIVKIFKCTFLHLEDICKNNDTFVKWYVENVKNIFKDYPDCLKYI